MRAYPDSDQFSFSTTSLSTSYLPFRNHNQTTVGLSFTFRYLTDTRIANGIPHPHRVPYRYVS